MRGIEVYEPGKFRLRHDLPLPEPGHGQVRVKVLAAGICGTDVHICEGDPSLEPMMRFPVVLGHEFCGRIEKLGDGVSGHEPGSYVSAEMHEFCNLCPACRAEKFHACQNTRIHGLWLDGCFADYVVVSAKNLVELPESLPVRAGAILDPLGNAVHCALKVPVRRKSVVVIGYGPIGAMAAEVMAFSGADPIYVTDVNPNALTRARRWAEAKGDAPRIRVLSTAGESREPALREVLQETDGGADVVLDFSGHPNGINDGLRLVRAAGDVVLLGLPTGRDVTIRDFGPNVIFKGITIHAIIGREVFGTWEKMLDLHNQGFDIGGLVTGEFALDEFETALSDFASGKEQKVVLYPNGRPS